MQSTNLFYNCPSTPAGPRNPLQFKPLNSSPLVAPDSPKMSSPMTGTQARRRSQYKTQIPSTPSSAGRVFYSKLASAGNTPEAEGDPQKAFLRSRFKARCFERAVKAREKAIRGRRAGTMSEPSSDDYAMDDDEEEDDEDIMQDELFRRIMANANEKKRHSYKVSYAHEVGSSFDPDLEDISSWEQELTNAAGPSASSSAADNRMPSDVQIPTTISIRSSDMYLMANQDDDEIPEEYMVNSPDLDDDELEAYAEEWEKRAAIADFADIPPEDLFSWSDGEDLSATPTPSIPSQDSNDAMDMS